MTYDEVADAAFIYITDPIGAGEVVASGTLSRPLERAAVTVSFDAADRVLGIELLGVSRLLRPEALPQQ